MTDFARPIRRLAAGLGLAVVPFAALAQTTQPAGGPPATQPAAAAATQPGATQPSATTVPPTVPSTNPAALPTTHPATQASTQPATQPATQASTRPAGPSPAVAAAIDIAVRGLGSPNWRVRERAAAELVRLGEDAKPALEDLVRTTENLDVRTAAQTTLRQIADNRLTGPSFVTLHLKDVPARQAFAELARQAYTDFKTYPENLWDNAGPGGGGQTVSINVERQPFWVAMRDLAGKTGLEFRDVNGGMRLMRGGGMMMNNGRPVVAGAFLIVANQITRTQSRQFAADGAGRVDENFAVQLMAFAEPKLRVLRASNQVKLEEVVDDKGNSLIPDAGMQNRFGFGGYYGGNSGAWSLYAPLKYPKDPGTKIARLRGSATFTIQTKSQKLEIPNLPGVKENVQVVGGSRVVIREFKKAAAGAGDSNWQLTLVVGRDPLGGGFDQVQTNIQNRLKVVDAQGQPLDQRGWSTSGRANEIEMTITFARSHRPDDGRMSGDPVKLEWEVPTESRDLPISFEFTDLPLFTDPPADKGDKAKDKAGQ